MRRERPGHGARLEPIEPRILFSADFSPALIDAPGDGAAVEQRSIDGVGEFGSVAATGTQSVRYEIVFVDAAVEDADVLLNDLRAASGSGRQLEFVFLDGQDDGIRQISDTLASRTDVSAIHLISHGSDGRFQLGDSAMDFDSLLANATRIKGWGDALSAQADILVYGCDVAQTEDGRSLLDALARLTGADVAGSTDRTGAARAGGDWDLEYHAGAIDAQGLIGVGQSAGWDAVLAISSNGTTTSAQTSSSNSLAWSHTVNAGADRVLVVQVAIDAIAAPAISVTYNGVALTQIGRGEGSHAVELWALVDPAVGTGSVVISFAGPTAAAGGATAYNGVDQDSPFGMFASASGNGTTSSVTLASAVGDRVIDAQHWQGNPSGGTPGAGQALTWWQVGTTMIAGSTTEAGAPSVTMSASFGTPAVWSIAAVSMRAANAAPLNSVPGTQGVTEDGAIAFSSSAGNQLTVSDADAGGGSNLVTLSVTGGSLTLASVAGLTFASGDGAADANMSFRGTASAINAALDGMLFTPAANYDGTAQLTLRTQDAVLTSVDVDTALRGRYAFDDSGAPGADSSPAAAHPAASTGVSGATDAARGSVAVFDTGDFLEVAGCYGNPASVTLAAWIDLAAAGADGAEVISLGDDVVLRLDDTQGGRPAALVGSIFDGTTWQQTSYDIALAGTGWHHVAFTFDGSSRLATLYLDGVAESSAILGSGIVWGSADTRIGAHAQGLPTYDFTGRMDEARVYSRALTGAQIAALARDVALTDVDTVAIVVSPVNDAPVLTTTGGSASYQENAAAVAIDPGLSVSDVDSSVLTGATVRIVSGYVNGEDQLAFTDQNGIAASWDAATGTLTLTGSASVAAYQAALRSVSYANASEDPSTASRSVEFAVTDGGLGSAALTRTLQVLAWNDAPQTLDIAASDAEDVAAIPLVLRGNDVDGSVDRFRLTSLPAHGTLYLDAGLTLPAAIGLDYAAASEALTMFFVPDADWNGSTGFGYVAHSDDGGSDATAASVSIDVTPVNDLPLLDLDADDSAGAGGADFAAVFVEDAGAVPIVDADAVLVDVDSAELTGLTVTLANLRDAGAEWLSADASGTSIAVSYDAGSGVLTLSGQDTIAHYQQVLRTLRYANTSDTPDTAARQVWIRADDNGQGYGNAALATVQVMAANDAPAGLPVVTGTPMEGGTLNVDPSTITDADGVGAFGYQWLRDGLPIVGATSHTYAPGERDVGAMIAVRVGYTDAQGSIESVDSASIGPMAGRPHVLAPGMPAPDPLPALDPLPLPAPAAQPAAGLEPLADAAPSSDAPAPAAHSAEAGNADHSAATEEQVGAPGIAAESAIGTEATGARVGGAGRAGQIARMLARLDAAAASGTTPAALRDATVGEEAQGDFLLLLAKDFGETARFVPSAPDGWEAQPAFTQSEENAAREELQVLVDSVKFGGLALSVGAVWWASRLSGLVGSMLASAPAWRHMDPLPVVGGTDDADQDSWYDEGDKDADANELAIALVLDSGAGKPSARGPG